MKLVMISLAATLCFAATPAYAGPHDAGINVTQQGRVLVYRGQQNTLNYNAIATLQAQKLQAQNIAAQERIARAQIAANERESKRRAEIADRRLRLDRDIYINRPSRVFGTNRGSRRFGNPRLIAPVGRSNFSGNSGGY